MKAVGAAIIILLMAYLADQQFADGKFTSAATSMMAQMRHSMGV
jgi:hypothetical protein